ncbi:MAG: hypothetical protein Q8L45_10025 [Xanthomonadaceae bacterium]|nr:hypothetical protein [Xanthomonadaceae bacterium]MDP2185063.1 hypothetical protein [Xanthomonadales bacterium]MDZ4117113.1 hypothetical protein [Xanthomonadaceae bacterium]MDZ4378582.1 hypothetical protein [Xanthomonadaceae bacterium]
MVIRKVATAAIALTAIFGLSGCVVTGEASAGCSTGSGCEAGAKVIIKSKEQLVAGRYADARGSAAIANAADLSLIDVNAIAIETYGSTVQIPPAGNMMLELIESTSGRMLAARQFDWVKVGSQLKLSNPAFVESWIQDNGAGADSVQYKLSSFPVTENDGANTFATAVTYAGETLASASYTWSGSGGGTCRDCQVQ